MRGFLEPKRYQLNKVATQVVQSGHPWVFRTQLSSAVSVFKSGQWLQLFDPNNKLLGYGIYETEGLIGIRYFGRETPSVAEFVRRVDVAISRRKNLRNYTDSFRVLHGENDRFPGVVIDSYGGKALVLQTYVPSVDGLGRFLAGVVRERLAIETIVWRIPSRRLNQERNDRWLRNGGGSDIIAIREGKLNYSVSLSEGQKGGSFLDLRGLRKWISLQKLNGKKVLNLFSYTGTLGLAAEVAGASEIWNVDASKGALDFGKKYNSLVSSKHRWIKADIFGGIEELAPNRKFDLIIVDPPSMVGSTSQVNKALITYRKLYAMALRHVAPKGRIVVCCCTSRIVRYDFQRNADRCFRPHLKRLEVIAPEDDHPVSFPEGDYLKLLVYG